MMTRKVIDIVLRIRMAVYFVGVIFLVFIAAMAEGFPPFFPPDIVPHLPGPILEPEAPAPTTDV